LLRYEEWKERHHMHIPKQGDFEDTQLVNRFTAVIKLITNSLYFRAKEKLKDRRFKHHSTGEKLAIDSHH
jgi:hypothetical protein